MKIDPSTGAAVLTIYSRTFGTFDVLVDVDDWERVSSKKWRAQVQKDGRVYFRAHNPSLSLHRYVMDAPQNLRVDHKNHDYMDCRKSELRVCTHQENMANQQSSRGSSKFKGVYWAAEKRKWCATIKIKSKSKNLGCKENEREAAHLYDVAAIESFGEFAKTNFPIRLAALSK